MACPTPVRCIFLFGGLPTALGLLALPQDTARQHSLHLIDVESLVELQLEWGGCARKPDLQFCISVEVTGGLHAKASNTPIRNRLVLDLAAGQPLIVDEDKPSIRENKHVTNELVGPFDTLFRDQDLGELCLNLRRVDRSAGLQSEPGMCPSSAFRYSDTFPIGLGPGATLRPAS
jgi:hypothetical protein